MAEIQPPPEIMSPIQTAAVAAMDRGWAVFSVEGKQPTTAKGLHDASREHRLAAIWWERHPTRGIGLATGMVSGVWVLDLDGQEATDRFAALQETHGPLPRTIAAKTGRGVHLYWRMPQQGDVRNSAGKVAAGIDVRGSGGYVVIPPSPHPSGVLYRWLEGRGPTELQPATAPAWLLRLVQAAPEGRTEIAGPVPDTLPEGSRNAQLTSLAGSMRRRGASEAAILAALETENGLRCVPPLELDEVRKIAASVGRYEPAPVQLVPNRITPLEPAPNGNGKHHAADRVTVTLDLIDRETLDRISAEKQLPLSVVPTPWPAWNRLCRGSGGGEGLAHGWHVVIGAGSGSGKSLSATNIAARAVRAGEHVALLSLEMSQEEVVTRLLSIYAGELARKLEHGTGFSPEAWKQAGDQLQEAEGSIRINRDPISTLDQIVLAIEDHIAQGCRTFIIDYLQLAWVRDADTMVKQITEVSHEIRLQARKHRILTIGLSQVNRQLSFGGGEMRKEGLLGGSSLENDADQVLLLSPPKPGDRGTYLSTAKLDKNRHGPPGEWGMVLDSASLRMREVMPDEEAAWRVG